MRRRPRRWSNTSPRAPRVPSCTASASRCAPAFGRPRFGTSPAWIAEVDPARYRRIGATGLAVAVAALVAGAGARRLDGRPRCAGRVVAGAAARAGGLAGIRGDAARRVPYSSGSAHRRASSDRHVVRPWFQGRLEFAPMVRDLSAQGFDLLGARLDRVGDRQAVAVVYRLHSHIINVFSWRATGDSADTEREATIRGFHVVTWRDRDMDFAVVSDTDSAELQRFVAAYRAP